MIPLQERQVQSILIVDDSTSNLVLMYKILATQGYHVELADNSEFALLQVTKAIPDLIILKLIMPTLDGSNVISYLRKEPRLAHIPILLLGDNSCLDPEEMKDLEENSVIYQPFDVDILLLSINSLLKSQNDREKNHHQQQVENVTLFQETITILDLKEEDPLRQEQQELEAIQNDYSTAIFWQELSTRGYEVVDCSLNNLLEEEKL